MTEEINERERWRLEARVDQLTAELSELRFIVAALDDIINLRQRGYTQQAAALLDDLQRNRIAFLRDRYPTDRP